MAASSVRKSAGENFGALLEIHPVYIDPLSSLAGGYMVNFGSYRKPGWNPDLDYPHLRPDIERYKLLPGIGAAQHFCQDMQIGLEIGWGGLLDKIRYYRQANASQGGRFLRRRRGHRGRDAELDRPHAPRRPARWPARRPTRSSKPTCRRWRRSTPAW